MAKKRPRKERPRTKRRAETTPLNSAELPDRRIVEGMMRQHVRGLTGENETPLSRAQDLIYQAMEERDGERRLALARQALDSSPDCADAYLLLAEQTPSRRERLALYEKAVAAGERAVGPEMFQRDAGHFWGILETRPYMRARMDLAFALWFAMRQDEAVAHLQDMLRLNPGDNQGIRYTLAGFLLCLDRDDDLGRLLDQFPDEISAMWAYTRALHAFRKQGDTAESRKLLEQAKKANRHIPDYLLSRKQQGGEPPSYYSLGDENEALSYLQHCLPGWKDTPGAIAWVRDQDEKVRKHKAQIAPPKGPLGLIKKWLADKLPQEFDVWEAAVRLAPEPVLIGEDRIWPWMLLVTSRSHDLVLNFAVVEEEPTPAHLWDILTRAMQQPLAGKPHRPTEVQVLSGEHWESLKSHAEEIGVQLTEVEELDQLDRVYAGVTSHLDEKPHPGLLAVPGMKPEQVGSFFEAADYYFREAPWRKIGFEAAIKVECDKYKGGPWYGVIMGQSGLTTGLALYEDLNAIWNIRQASAPNRENTRESVTTSLIFGDDVDLSFSDMKAIRQYGWKVARSDAYPWVFHKERGMSLRPPLTWELELMEACLRALPDFVRRRKQDDSTREAFTVTVTAGELHLALSWVLEPSLDLFGMGRMGDRGDS